MKQYKFLLEGLFKKSRLEKEKEDLEKVKDKVKEKVSETSKKVRETSKRVKDDVKKDYDYVKKQALDKYNSLSRNKQLAIKYGVPASIAALGIAAIKRWYKKHKDED